MKNPHETDARGRLLEELYEACMALPADQRDPYIVRNANGDARLVGQLRAMVLLPDPLGANPLSTTTTPVTSPSFELPSGTVFGDCQIVSEIGAGAMGAVYLARDLKNFNRLVALKVMKPAEIQPHDLERFADETAALSRLVHPHIAQFYYRGIQHWQGSDRPFLVMEYVDGQTLDDYLAENKPAENQIIELLRKICIAVHHGHLKGVFHRDLKPSNILVTPAGEPKIIDFGVSFMVSAEPAPDAESKLIQTVGTLLYMAPETAGGRPFVPDPQTDVYSLGIIAFEAFAGRRPGVVVGPNRVELLEAPLTKSQVRRHIGGCEREKLRSVNRSFGRDLECVIGKSLKLKKENRYSDAAEFAEDLRRVADLEPIHARTPSRIYNSFMFARRNRLAVSLICIAFLGVLTAAIALGISRARTRESLREVADANAKIQQQYAASLLRAGQFAEQRGNWRAAAEQYHAAAQAHAADELTVTVGELRSLERLGRGPEMSALIKHVEQTMPAIAQSPQFQLEKGLAFWSTQPEQSLRAIKSALQQRDKLNPAECDFAEALTTDDVKLFSPKLRESVQLDPFNRDAWVILLLTDLFLGDARRCEHEASVLTRLYPEDQAAPTIATCAAAFQGHPADAIHYLDSATELSADVKSRLRDIVDFLGTRQTFDDFTAADTPHIISMFVGLYPVMGRLQATGDYPVPVTFKEISDFFLRSKFAIAINPELMLVHLDRVLPNGLGETIIGVQAIQAKDFPAAIHHLETALVTPSLIDCRRRIAFALTVARIGDFNTRHAPAAEVIRGAKIDLDRLISLGGARPDIHRDEAQIFQIAASCDLPVEVRSLANDCLMHAPDHPTATFYLAWAESRLGHAQAAVGLYQKAIEIGLPAELNEAAQTAVRELGATAKTRPATMP